VVVDREFSTRLKRAKLALPLMYFSVCLISCVVLFAWLTSTATAQLRASQTPNTRVTELIICLAVVIPLGFWLEIVAVRRLINPDRLTINKVGIVVQRFGKTVTYLWPQLGEPAKRVLKSGQLSVIDIPIMDGGKKVSLPADQYIQPLDTVLMALSQARHDYSGL
jgi:hypothetical protein